MVSLVLAVAILAWVGTCVIVLALCRAAGRADRHAQVTPAPVRVTRHRTPAAADAHAPVVRVPA